MTTKKTNAPASERPDKTREVTSLTPVTGSVALHITPLWPQHHDESVTLTVQPTAVAQPVASSVAQPAASARPATHANTKRLKPNDMQKADTGPGNVNCHPRRCRGAKSAN